MSTSYKTLGKKPRPSDCPPFTLKEVKASIPSHCFERSTFKSSCYLLVNLSAMLILCNISCYIDHPMLPKLVSSLLWPVYWITQGCVCTGLWVLAHECGHYAFSESKVVCDAVGLVLHTALLVPYHSWRLSHAKHHRSTNDMDHDEVFVPNTKAELNERKVEPLSVLSTIVSLIKTLLLGWPGYLSLHVSGRKYHTHTDHFNPKSPLFTEKDYFDIILSDIALFIWIGFLVYLGYVQGFLWLVKVYVIPYLIVNFWLVLITDLQHTDAAVPHYRGKHRSWIKGALCTIDRDYGLLNHIFHHIGDTHIAHHLFSHMPHYHAVEATNHIKNFLGKYYYKDETPIFKAIWQNERFCRYVDNVGEVLWFKHD